MSRDIFGMTPEGLHRRIVAEKRRADELKNIFCELIDQIKYTAEEDGWHRLVIFSNNSPTFDGLSYLERSAILYYLRRHPNIISKLSDKERRVGGLDSMKPYVFKWVKSSEKEELGANANFFRHISREGLKAIGSKVPNSSTGLLVDVFSILEFLLGKKAKSWIELSTFNISAFSGVPIENTRAALNTLLKMKLVVIAYVSSEVRKTRSRLNIRLIFNEADYISAMNGEGIKAKKILTDVHALNGIFTFNVTNYFYNAVSRLQKELSEKKINNEENILPSTEQTIKKISTPQQVSIPLNLGDESTEEKNSDAEKIPEVKKISEVENKTLPAPNYPPINIVMPEVPGLNNALDEIKSCVTSFTNIAESMYKSEEQKYKLLEEIIKTNAKQRQEYDDLYNQMVAMKKILNQKDRDKDLFVKAIQDALNMMMGKIISATDEFSKIPRHLIDEQKLQTHKAEVIQITVQTAEEIRKLAGGENRS